MNRLLGAAGTGLVCAVFTVSSCSMEQEKAAAPAKPAPTAEAKAPPAEAKAEPAKKEEKAKPIKAKGDVGLLDLEKNYMILVTKEGKLITADFNQKTKVTKVEPVNSKVDEIGLGSSATVEYQTKDDKKVATKIEFRPAKGGE
jgi:hypothetical protein